MSIEALLWATSDAPIANVNEFAVLVMLAEKADPDGCNAFPSRPTVAARTHIDPKTVLRTLQRLEARGLIGKGDQAAAAYLRADRRPVVYDLLIPYGWFPNIERINKERQDRGRPPLTPIDRPPIVKAPEKKRRSDLGTRRKATTPGRGDSQSPRLKDGGDVHGVTVSPERGDSQSGTGGLVVTQPSPLTQSLEPDAPSARSAAVGARSASTSGSRPAGREGGFAASSKTQPAPRKQEAQPAPERPPAAETKPAKPRQHRHTRQQLDQARAVAAHFPPELGVELVPKLTDAILAALAGDAPGADRTVDQIGARIQRRWDLHGHAARFHAGTLTRPVGTAVALVRPLAAGDRYGCANPRCEDGADVDTGEPCTVCPERIADRRAARQSARSEHNGPGARPSAASSAARAETTPPPRRPVPQPAGPYDAPQPAQVPTVPKQVQPVGDYAAGASAARAVMHGSKAEAHRRTNLLNKAR